jgi:hypothetical protein
MSLVGDDRSNNDEIREVSDSFTLSANVGGSFALDGPSISRLIRSAVSRFESAGAVVNPSSRLPHYASLFDRERATDESESVRDVALLEALQFVAISDSLDADRLRSLAGHLSIAASGSIDAGQDRQDCKARSLQFELFLLSCLQAAGLKVEAREPDIMVTTSRGANIAIAAKRLRSTAKLSKNLRKGRSQVLRSKVDGLVAIDLSFLEAIQKPVYVRDFRHHQIVSKVVLDQFVHVNAKTVMALLAGTAVVGVLFHYGAVVHSLEPHSMVVSRRWLLLQTQAPPVNDATHEIIERLQIIGRGSPEAASGPESKVVNYSVKKS